MSSSKVWEDGHQRGLRQSGWSFSTCKASISNAQELEAAAEKVHIPLPEITFGNNYVSLAHPAFSLKFSTFDSLNAVDPTGEAPHCVKVAHAAEWAKSRNIQGHNDFSTVRKFDWTYTTNYSGSAETLLFTPAPAAHQGIPLERLARQDEPILFYDDVTLFEDELHDCGVANLSVKIRVMPSSFFLLSRFFLRVDHVLFRVYDTRIYHEFGSNEVIRERKGKQASYREVKENLPHDRKDDLTPLTDPNWVANVLKMVELKQSHPAPATIQPERTSSSQQHGGQVVGNWEGVGTWLDVAHLSA